MSKDADIFAVIVDQDGQETNVDFNEVIKVVKNEDGG